MRHHFVPQFLLAAWAEGNADAMFVEFRIFIPDIPMRRRVPKATGYMPDLLALSQPVVAGMSQQDIEEKLMKQVDTDAARVRKKMLSQGVASLTNSERCDWARFLNSLRVRQPSFVEKAKRDAKADLMSELSRAPEQYQALAKDGDPTSLGQWVDKNMPGYIENFGLTLYPSLIDNAELGTKVINLKWMLRDLSSAKHELLLADNPCTSIGNIDHPEMIIALPLSPTKLFVACRGSGTARTIERAESEILVVRANESSVTQARARLYSRTEAPARFIRNKVAILRRERGQGNGMIPTVP